MLSGRKRIYTDENLITVDNVRKIVLDAMAEHTINETEMKALLKISRGEMDLIRVKEIRPEIDIKAIDPIASQIVDFKVGFEHGTPISYIQRANVDSGNGNANVNEIQSDDLRILTLNEMMREVNKSSKDLKLATYIKKVGLGYRYIYPKAKRNGISPFDIAILNPLRTFVIYSNDVFERPILAVTYTVGKANNVQHFSAWTETSFFEFDNNNGSPVKEQPNVLGLIPIIEYDNNEELMGCFEKEIPLIDSLNVVTSDRINDICQTVQSILWIHNAKIDENQKKELVDGGVLQTQANADGKDAKIQYVNAPLNQTEIQTLADSLRERILESAGVPKLSEASNTTGEAMRVTNGWHTAETQARKSELMWRMSEDATLEVCLAIIARTKGNPNDVASLKLSDIDYKVYRSENYDITSRVNAFATLVGMGADITKAASYCKITDDPAQFAKDSEENMNRLRFANGSSEDKTKESIQPDTVAF